MNNQVQTLKISSTHYKIKKLNVLLIIGIISCLFLVPEIIFADVFIPEHEYLGYFDSTGIYTVVGNVKNTNDYAVIPTITISITDDDTIHSKTFQHVPIASGKEIPFKVKFSEITGTLPLLNQATLTFEKTFYKPPSIEILYDDTLVTYPDGHLTGRIQNNGDKTIYNAKIFAVVHGYDKVLDVAQNIEQIEQIKPGQIIEFSMFPDPAIIDDVFYYSCFAPVDTSVIPITTKKDEGYYNFRYDSGSWYYDAKFNEEGTIMTIRGYNSFPIETYANFELPPISGKEKFLVTFNDEPVDFIQSIDEMKNWHVAFNVEPHSQGVLTISGFEKGLPPERPLVPIWIKNNGKWWITNQIPDNEFLEGIDFLFEKGIIFVPQKNLVTEYDWKIPSWTKTIVQYWTEDQITDEDFVAAIEYLVAKGTIVV